MQEEPHNTATAADPEAPADNTGDLAEVQRQRDDFQERLLRTAAEFDNYRKRVDRERQQTIESASASLITDLLPLIDDFERALRAESGPAGADAYREGVELIQKQLLDVLSRRGVRPIEALGADFDPHYHQAVSYEPVEGHRDGEVIEEFRRGYMLGDRLLRPAMVKVAKA